MNVPSLLFQLARCNMIVGSFRNVPLRTYPRFSSTVGNIAQTQSAFATVISSTAPSSTRLTSFTIAMRVRYGTMDCVTLPVIATTNQTATAMVMQTPAQKGTGKEKSTLDAVSLFFAWNSDVRYSGSNGKDVVLEGEYKLG